MDKAFAKIDSFKNRDFEVRSQGNQKNYIQTFDVYHKNEKLNDKNFLLQTQSRKNQNKSIC